VHRRRVGAARRSRHPRYGRRQEEERDLAERPALTVGPTPRCSSENLAMKALSALCCLIMFASPVRAERTSTHLTTANLKDQPFAFAIDVERAKNVKRGDCLRFRVTVRAKADQGSLSPRRWAQLKILDGEAVVSSCRLEPSEREGGISYSF